VLLVAAAGAALLIAAFAHAKDPELPSSFRRADVRVDGIADDWQGKLIPIGDAPVVLGVVNDASFVYVCVKTSDEATRKKILHLGLSVYLDSSGKEDRAFGVRFPVGRGRGRPDVPITDDAGTASRLDVSAAGAYLEVLGKEESDVGRMSVSEARPIDAALSENDGTLVIELKVPLAFSVDSPHAVESAPGKTIALGLETTEPKLKRSRSGGGGRGGGMGGGMGGGRGMGGGGGRMGGGGMGGGRGPGGDRDARNEAKAMGKPLKLWVRVPLATEPSSPPA